MVAMFYGALGAFLTLLVLAMGIIIGRMLAMPKPPADKPTEAELKRIREAQEAFDRLQNYTVEQAYGMTTPLNGVDGGE